MSNFIESLNQIKEVARLEGWDTGQIDIRARQYQEGNEDIKERIELPLTMAVEWANDYLRIRKKRSEDFWAICRTKNETSMREYTDLRTLARQIKNCVYPKDKVRRDKIKSSGSSDSDSSEV